MQKILAIFLLLNIAFASKQDPFQLSYIEHNGDGGYIINGEDMPLKEILTELADLRHENIIILEKTLSNISLKVSMQSSNELLESILIAANLDSIKVATTLFVGSAEKVATINSKLANKNFINTNFKLINTTSETIKYELLNNGLLKEGRDNFIVLKSGLINIKSTSANLKKIAKFISAYDQPLRQVKIKAYLVSVDQDYLQELGLNWQQHQKLNSNIKSSGNSAFYLDKILSLSQGALDLKIKALEEHGRGELLSSPELITTNGQTAIIETGDEIPYLQSQQDGSNTLVFKKAVLRLQVKPEIIANSKVKMHVVINQDQPGFSYGDALAIKTRKIVTDAMVLDSKTLALGGIFESYKAITKTGVPLLKELPFLGNIFTMTDKKTKKRQLVIFITPFILP